jgi:membrane dipeptidase
VRRFWARPRSDLGQRVTKVSLGSMPALDPAVARILAAEPAFDAHTDALQRALDLGHDLLTRTRGQFDLVRAREGGCAAAVLVCWVDPEFIPSGAAQRARDLIGAGRDLEERSQGAVKLIERAADLDRARQQGAFAALLGIEGGHALEERIDLLEDFYQRGVRVLTLVWNNHLSWIRSCQAGAGPEIPAGLSDLGRRIVRRMDELGMVIDLSHAGEQSFYDTLATTRHPVIASHSGCRALHDHPRNLTDDQLRALAANGGVLGVVFHPGFLDAAARSEEARVRELPAYQALAHANGTELFLRQSELMQATAAPLPLARLIEHIEHALRIAGPAHVGLGSDFDGIQRGPDGAEDAQAYARIAAVLHERGHGDALIQAVSGGNMQRVFQRVLV